jgi:glycosyltransferase involved in cell wall biosynthesis
MEAATSDLTDKKQQIASSPGTLKILMVGALPLDLDLVKGGVEAVIMNLFSGFRNMDGVKIIHLAFTKETKTPRKVNFAQNITIHFLPFIVKYELADYFINDKTIQGILETEKPQIIHLQEITPHIIRFLKYPKENIVVTQHGIMREELKYASGLPQKLKCLFKAFVERYVFPRFTNVIFISRYNQTLYPPQPIHGQQIFNPVNPIFFSGAGKKVSNNRSMVYVGVLSRRKNIGIVIEALQELKKQGKIMKLHVVGGFKDREYENEIHSLIRQYDLKEQIIFHGWLSQEQIRRIYEDTPVFILPSLQETLPVSIGEAMALGKIVIASDVGAIGEMFTADVSGFLFKKNNLEELVTILTKLYDTSDLTSYSEKAAKEAAEKFHPVLIAEKTLQFYREVIALQKAKV